MVRRLSALVTTLAVGVLGASCSRADARTDLVVGALYPTTGTQAAAGIEELRGVRLAVERVNAVGGIGGRKVRLVTSDAPTPESASPALYRLLNRHVRVVLGSHSSAISNAVSLASRSRNVTFFETGAVGSVDAKAGGRTFFRLSPMGANLGRDAVAFVGDRLQPNRPLRWAVAHVDDVYGSAVGEGAVAEIKRRGYELAGDFSYDIHSFDPAALAAQIAAAKPDALFVSSYLDDGVALRRATAASGMKLLAEIGTSSSYCHPAFGAALGAAAVGLFASDKPDAGHVRADALQPAGRQALEWVAPRYRSRYHDDMSAPALSGFSGGLAVLAHLLPAARSDAPGAVRAAAERVHLPEGSLPNGSGLDLAPAGARDAGDNRAASSVIWEWVAPGVRAVVWPPAYATAPISR
jgi:branched-chain amino acid transport system substrate-binding protein